MIVDLSVHHVERFVLEAGYTVQRLGSDYGYDLLLTTFDEQGYVEPGSVSFQLKAMEVLDVIGTDYVYDLDIRDYNLWLREKIPVILILYDALRRRAYWLAVQKYFATDPAREPKQGAKTVRVHVPRRQIVNRRAIGKMRRLKWEAPGRPEGEPS